MDRRRGMKVVADGGSLTKIKWRLQYDHVQGVHIVPFGSRFLKFAGGPLKETRFVLAFL
jgi:hypothetical protein